MSAPMIPSAMEGPYPLYSGAPPDQQPTDLQGALAMVDSIIWRDGGMDDQEMSILGAWFQKTMLQARASIAAAQQGQGPPATASPLGSSSAAGGATDYNPFSGPGGQDVGGGPQSGPF